jgi:RimJ/RimL family protein N-acetyltransferase
VIAIALLTGAEKAVVADLKPAGGQERFVRDGGFAAAETDPALDLYAVRQGGAVVGMFKLDRAYAEAPCHDFCQPGDLGLRGVLVDAGQQGKGIGRQMLAALPALVRAGYPGVRRLVLTVNCQNPVARAAYLAAGWQDDGRLYLGGDAGPQHVLTFAL